jgi:CRISPR system Cascade subunit CasB
MERPTSRAETFVNFIITRIHQDNGIAAALRRADNPGTEYQSWEQLVAFNIDLNNEGERLPHATIAAAIAKAKIQNNGNTGRTCAGKLLRGCI